MHSKQWIEVVPWAAKGKWRRVPGTATLKGKSWCRRSLGRGKGSAQGWARLEQVRAAPEQWALDQKSPRHLTSSQIGVDIRVGEPARNSVEGRRSGQGRGSGGVGLQLTPVHFATFCVLVAGLKQAVASRGFPRRASHVSGK